MGMAAKQQCLLCFMPRGNLEAVAQMHSNQSRAHHSRPSGLLQEVLKYYREGELTNGRWAMAAVAGILFTDLVRAVLGGCSGSSSCMRHNLQAHTCLPRVARACSAVLSVLTRRAAAVCVCAYACRWAWATGGRLAPRWSPPST